MKLTALSLAVGTLMVGLIGTAAPAQAAVSQSHWTLGWGASTTKGTITWGGGRTATVNFSTTAVSGARQVCLTATSGNGSVTDEYCNTTPAGYSDIVSNLEMHIPAAGGAQHLYVAMWADGGWRRSAHCTRAQSGCASTS